jgi:hypothetical protein
MSAPRGLVRRHFSRMAVDRPLSSRKSSIFLRRIIGAMFMRVNCKCAHQLRPPLRLVAAEWWRDAPSGGQRTKLGWDRSGGQAGVGCRR